MRHTSNTEHLTSSHRPTQYLEGISNGKWIVSLDWLKDSVRAREWLPEADYEIKGTRFRWSSGGGVEGLDLWRVDSSLLLPLPVLLP